MLWPPLPLGINYLDKGWVQIRRCLAFQISACTRAPVCAFLGRSNTEWILAIILKLLISGHVQAATPTAPSAENSVSYNAEPRSTGSVMKLALEGGCQRRAKFVKSPLGVTQNYYLETLVQVLGSRTTVHRSVGYFGGGGSPYFSFYLFFASYISQPHTKVHYFYHHIFYVVTIYPYTCTFKKMRYFIIYFYIYNYLILI